MRRGEVWFAATPGGDRPVLVLTRDPVAARIGANPSATGGQELRSWQRQAAAALPGLQCEVTALGGAPPAYRVELRWPAGSGDAGRLVLWTGR